MKTITLLVSCFFYSIATFASNEVPIDSAKNYVGKTITICSKIYGSKSFDKVTLLNLGAKHPESPLTIAIFEKDRANFSAAPSDLYDGKNVCVTGTVQLYKGKAEIVVSKPEEIVVQDKPTIDR